MQNSLGTDWTEDLSNIIKIAIPSLLLGAVKMAVMVNDKKTTVLNAIISYLVSVILATTICFYLKDSLSPIIAFTLNSVITLAGVNIMRAIMYKKDWHIYVDAIFGAMVDWVKRKFK